MIPEANESLSFLMGASQITDAELAGLGISIVHRQGQGIRGLVVPDQSLHAYRELIRRKLSPGYWNETVGRSRIVFQFKLADGTLEEFAYSDANRAEIARLCTQLNQDPAEETADLLTYIAANPFYVELMVSHHGVGSGR